MTPQIVETAPSSGEYVLAHGKWIVVDELPEDARCRGCHKHVVVVVSEDDRPWAEVPQGRRPPALFCPECLDEFKHGRCMKS